MIVKLKESKEHFTVNTFNDLFIFFLDILRKLGFQKESFKENSIDEEEEIPEA